MALFCAMSPAQRRGAMRDNAAHAIAHAAHFTFVAAERMITMFYDNDADESGAHDARAQNRQRRLFAVDDPPFAMSRAVCKSARAQQKYASVDARRAVARTRTIRGAMMLSIEPPEVRCPRRAKEAFGRQAEAPCVKRSHHAMRDISHAFHPPAEDTQA